MDFFLLDSEAAAARIGRPGPDPPRLRWGSS
jgi:hypothetical protein